MNNVVINDTTHIMRPYSNEQEGRTLCGIRWLTFNPRRFKRITSENTNCMTCLIRETRQ